MRSLPRSIGLGQGLVRFERSGIWGMTPGSGCMTGSECGFAHPVHHLKPSSTNLPTMPLMRGCSLYRKASS